MVCENFTSIYYGSNHYDKHKTSIKGNLYHALKLTTIYGIRYLMQLQNCQSHVPEPFYQKTSI